MLSIGVLVGLVGLVALAFGGLQKFKSGRLAKAPFVKSHDAATRARVEDIVYRPLAAIGGSVSAEHGIGLEKRNYLPLSRTAAEISTMRLLKNALDPRGILNPGKVFT